MSISKCCRCGVLSSTVGAHHPVCSTCLEEEISTLKARLEMVNGERNEARNEVSQLKETWRIAHECVRCGGALLDDHPCPHCLDCVPDCDTCERWDCKDNTNPSREKEG